MRAPFVAPWTTARGETITCETGYDPHVQRLGVGDVHVWFTRPDRAAGAALTARYDALLSADERERHRRFHFDRDRHHFLVAHALVRTTLSRYSQVDPAAWTFTRGPHGRPEIASPAIRPGLRFNLSHTPGLVTVAVALDADVGIDVEGLRTRDTSIAIARRFFAPAEVAYLLSRPAPEHPRIFLEIWTLKEAYIKATGEGFRARLDRFVMQLDDPPTVTLEGRATPSDQWHCRRLALGADHIAALAVRQPDPPSVVIRETVPLVDIAIAD